jgi:hypothetical protein
MVEEKLEEGLEELISSEGYDESKLYDAESKPMENTVSDAPPPVGVYPVPEIDGVVVYAEPEIYSIREAELELSGFKDGFYKFVNDSDAEFFGVNGFNLKLKGYPAKDVDFNPSFMAINHEDPGKSPKGASKREKSEFEGASKNKEKFDAFSKFLKFKLVLS